MQYRVYHSFKEAIFVPLMAISPNVAFILDKGEKTVTLAGGVQASVKRCEYVHILSERAQEIINKLYKLDDVYAFMKKWYASMELLSMEFIYLELEKI